ncbi:MAG: M1 family aminopeptidase [Bacteroidota bacterium]|nr:M1 family aminopeptidase [Bacteroidota bacterium]
MMVAIALLGCTTLLWAADISSPVRYIEQSFDVLHYDAFLALDSLPRPILGQSTCTWTVRWRRAPDTLRFHLRSLRVERVEYLAQGSTLPVQWFERGQPSDATYHYAVGALPQHRAGDTVQLRITYSGTMTGEPVRNGLSWGGVQQEGSIVYALGVGFYNNYVSATQHWLACYDHPSDKATFSLAFRVPSSYVVASNGEELPVRDSSQWRIYRFRSRYPAATYLLTFAAIPASVLSVIRDTTSLPVPILLYARRADSAATARSFRLLPAMVQTFERLYGAYPFEKVGYVMTQKGAMEHQTMISYPTSLARTGDTVNLIAAHELAHQWFGNCVTPYDFRDAWFNESFATLSESLWQEARAGYRAYLELQQRKIAAYLNQYAKAGSPLYEGVLTMYDFSRTPPSSNYPHVIYEKGAAVLGMLRYIVGDSVFFGWCRTLMERYRYGNVSIDTLQQTLAAQSGKPELIERFFSEWIRGKGWAVLDIEALRIPTSQGWKAVVRIVQRQPDSLGRYTTLPLELSFIGADTVHRQVLMTAEEQTVEFDSLNAFTTIAINVGKAVRSLVLLAARPQVSNVEAAERGVLLHVYPNPATEVIWVIPTVPLQAVELHDSLGKLVRRLSARGPVALPAGDLPSGAYTAVGISEAGERTVVPFVVTR